MPVLLMSLVIGILDSYMVIRISDEYILVDFYLIDSHEEGGRGISKENSK